MTVDVGWVATVIAALFGGGGLVAFLRLKTDTSKVIVDAAGGAVIVQAGVITNLRQELEEVRRRLDTVEAQAEAAALRAVQAERQLGVAVARADQAERQRDAVMRANDDLRDRVEALEAEVIRLGGSLPAHPVDGE